MDGPTIITPQNLDGITPEWLSAVLSQRHPGTKVSAVRFGEPIRGTGTNVGLTLAYACQPEGAALPERMWLKSCYEPHFDHMAPSRIYEIEAKFYLELASRLDVRVPNCYYAGIDEASHQSVLLLEDLGAQGVKFGKATEPVSPDFVASGLTLLARMHASTWGQAWPHDLWYVEKGIPRSGPAAQWYREQTPEVFAHYIRERAVANVPDSVNDPKRIVEAFWKLAEMSCDEPRCVIHSDAHLDNFYFYPDNTAGLMDWTAPRSGSWAWDVSYFVISALAIELRRAHERALLRHYLKELEAFGGPALTMDEAWLAYRQYNAYGLFVKIVNPDVFKPREINLAWMSRHVAATEDLETFASLGV
jgi:aminoglycoside/choline kinase family phosphotransferase